MKKNTLQTDLQSEEIGAAIRAFMAESCPACDGQKVRRSDPFCPNCTDKLPPQIRESISDRSQFIETYHPAIKYLSDRTNGSAK